MAYKVFIDSSDLVCKPNAIGCSQVIRYVENNKNVLTTDMSEADFIIVNTCGFDKKHENLSRDIFAKCFQEKKAGAKVVSIGCLNVINREVLESQFPDLEIVTDNTRLDELLGADVRYDNDKNASLDESLFDLMKENLPQPLFVNTTLLGARLLYSFTKKSKSKKIASLHIGQIIDEIERKDKIYVLIGRGCVGRCAYCIIKKAQGSPRSRTIDNIMEDIRHVYKPGKVLCLVADDCASYGVDNGLSLAVLLDRITEEFPDLPIDIGYINPLFIEQHFDDYLEMFKKANINNVNISMQSGSDKVIGLMNRKYKAATITRFIDKIKEVSPGTMIWTHCLVGFPGETWKDFYLSLKALDHFHYYNMFPFSAREGTPAASMENQNSRFVCELRAKIAYSRLALRLAFKSILCALAG